ncbi:MULTISPECIES: hypothetical protein [unclassified Marinitoga]|uniref:hypothetical protein n=1 Tax=unclassified Marinitoga TaxID=2640159 RepID=UPI000640D137|nr:MULTISPECIES: hypothetical protein [unclassified Marinitoga]KLO25156.1 hypothetical protein X274_00495 [Marinitoga sp. 1155]NUU98696.1 hypothetical protein [Marinitoga sp. 1154]
MSNYDIFFKNLEYDYIKIIEYLKQFKNNENLLIKKAKKIISVKENIIPEIKLISDICTISNNEVIKYAIIISALDNVYDNLKKNYNNKDINKLIRLLLYIENYVYNEFNNKLYIDKLLKKVYHISNKLQKIISK